MNAALDAVVVSSLSWPPGPPEWGWLFALDFSQIVGVIIAALVSTLLLVAAAVVGFRLVRRLIARLARPRF